MENQCFLLKNGVYGIYYDTEILTLKDKDNRRILDMLLGNNDICICVSDGEICIGYCNDSHVPDLRLGEFTAVEVTDGVTITVQNGETSSLVYRSSMPRQSKTTTIDSGCLVFRTQLGRLYINTALSIDPQV